MILKIRRTDATSADKLAEALRSQIPDLPTYLHANWDSVEASVCDYLEEHEEMLEIYNDFGKDWLIENAHVYASILSRLTTEYSNIEVKFELR